MRVQHVYFSLAVTQQCMENIHYFNEMVSIVQLLLDTFLWVLVKEPHHFMISTHVLFY